MATTKDDRSGTAAAAGADDKSGTAAGADGTAGDARAEADFNEKTGSIYEPSELMDPERPFSAENPVKTAVVARDGEDKRDAKKDKE